MNGHDMDIATYVHDNLTRPDPNIENGVLKKASGIFMWVVLAVAMLNEAYDEGRIEAMEQKLREVPSDLDELFSTILSKESSAQNGHKAVVKLLLDTGKVDADAQEKNGWAALHIAAANGHELVVKLLLDTGKADADPKNRFGQTVLYWAAENGHEAVVKLLLDIGKVDAGAKDKNGQTALHMAAKNGYEAVIKLLSLAS
ncbi:hypothetical protein N0V85_009375 [Neurospora sp. IMI 360204]|nr:hypothetical protein N0V85_009375 [Neurospora sp. IMI 360204]